jgi:transposase
MDMWEPYINSVEANFCDAHDKIVFDRFHIMKHMGEAVDTVREREHRSCAPRASSSSPAASTSGSTPSATSRQSTRDRSGP